MNIFSIDKNFRLCIIPVKSEQIGFAKGKFLGGVAWVYPLVKKFCQGQGLDIGGSGGSKFVKSVLPSATLVDKQLPRTGDAENLSQYQESSQDFVLMSHCLEHVKDPEECVRQVHRVLKKDGVFFLYNPYEGHHQWDPAKKIEPYATVHLWQPQPNSLGRLLLYYDFDVVYNEQWKDDHWGFITIGKAKK